MPEEQWRDELQEYALLVEAVSSGDRSKVVKLFGDYILRKKAAEAIEEAVAEIESEAAVENEYVDEEDDERDHNVDGGEETLDSGEAYEEDYMAQEYENYYDEDEPGEHEQTQGKRVRFADDEGGGGEEHEYYDDEGNPLYDDHENEFGDQDDGYYEEEYNPDEYVGGEDTIPYMSGALPSEHNESNEYDQGTYGDEFDYDDNSQSYEQGDQFENTNIQDMDHQQQYKDYYSSSDAAGGYDGDGYHDSAQDEGFYDYDVNQQDGGEWSKAVNENERVTDDEVQDNGMNNNNNYEFDNPYGEEKPIFRDELNDLMDRLQQTMNAHEYDGGEERQGKYDDEEGYPDYGLGVPGGNSAGVGETYQQCPYPDDEEESVQERSIPKRPPYPDDEEGHRSDNHNPDQIRHPDYEESNYDEEPDDFDFWADESMNQANVQGNLGNLDRLQRQHLDQSLDKESGRRRDNIAPDNDDLDEEGYDEEDYDENYSPQTNSTERVWVDSVRPHYDDDDQAPFPGFHRTISNDQVLPYAILPGNRFDMSMRRDSMEEVNPTYNVFDAGQRFYDHYSDNREDHKRDAKKTNQRGALHPMSLVDKFRERLYAN